MKKLLTFLLCMCVMPLFSHGKTINQAIRDAKKSLYVYTDDTSVISELSSTFSLPRETMVVVSLDAAKRSRGNDLNWLVQRCAEVWVVVNGSVSETAVVVDRRYAVDGRRKEVYKDDMKVKSYINEWKRYKSKSIPCR